MFNLPARMEINDAWTNVVLADAYLAQRKYKEADAAIRDAELHYRKAESAVTIERSDSILDKLADIRIKLDQIRSAIKIKAGIVVQ